MHSDFDSAAASYDQDFTHSQIGKLQRQQVYDFLSTKILKDGIPLNILELNCGTGEDALWLANMNHQVTATDISNEMLQQAKSKGNLPNLNFQLLDINKLKEYPFQSKFNLIFSNFGGLNCLSKPQLKQFFEQAAHLLNSNGSLVLVMMPKHCLWDKFYHFAKGQWSQMNRRNRPEVVPVNVNGNSVNTWFYNPKEIVYLTEQHFKCEHMYPVGLAVPPSFLEPFFRNKKGVLSLMAKTDKSLKHFKGLAKYADHFIMELKLK
ncbi:bifunctional 2-polyprenyl-6-hydroxyphenol methylase/3-demethylubiquinol 3-O-methyltransferase UbiG [Mangrovimonas sp. TPBH4]|uniref:class I SAM-dependent methyltransferase n=1 Tax=Mangrovimonas sp. TPBH4 TaxID=1645914 RepID=UPI0006B4FBFE|nr:class I SAM-dependent methyltransferase [Mangrovimonas sp. TPBH4]